MSVYGSSTVKRQRRTVAELDQVDDAIVQAVEADHPVTLRGVYYRAVSAGAVDKTENGYRLVGRQLLKLRRQGVIPYSHITDGTRWITKPASYTNLEEMLEGAASSYRRALWHDQEVEVHVFTEKDAISGVVLPVTSQWDVPLGVLRGYASESFAHSVAQAIQASGKDVRVYQLGDHDPSGVDAWRDFCQKVADFLLPGARAEWAEYVPPDGPDTTADVLFFDGDRQWRGVRFERLAVTGDQIAAWQLPTRPTKRTDTRASRFEGGSVEVDAIPAGQLRTLVEAAILQHVDQDQLAVLQRTEQRERKILTAFRATLGEAR